MHEINKVLKAAAWRIGVASFLWGWVIAATALLIAAVVTRLIQQTLGFNLPWLIIAYVAAGVSVVFAVVWAISTRPGRIAVARRVDEGANLRESISTALCVENQKDDPWARATVETAVVQARRVHVRQAVPIQAPKFWPVPVALALTLAVLYFMPRLDLLGWEKKAVAKKQQEANILAAKAEVAAVQQKKEEIEKKLGLEKQPDEPLAGDKPESKDPEAMRTQALKDLTKLADRIEQMQNSPKSQAMKEVQAKLGQLQTPGKETSELTKALMGGDFTAAQKAIEQMKNQMNSGNMSEAQRNEMSKQLDELAKQMEEMAKNKQGLESALKQAGMDPKLAADPKALEQALQNNQNLSAEQKSALQQAQQAQQQSQSAMQSLSQSMSKMAEACKNGSQSQQGQQMQTQAAQGAQQQLSEMEMAKAELAQSQAAMSELQQQLQQMGQCNSGDSGKSGEGKQGNSPGMSQGDGQCQSQGWSNAFAQQQGKGGRGRGGQGFSGTRDQAKADFDTERKRSIGPQGNGPFIGTRLVEGDSIKGESTAEFAATVAQADQSATEAMETNTIPREFHDAIKNYFGGLKQRANPGSAPAPKPADAPASKPAAEPKK